MVLFVLGETEFTDQDVSISKTLGTGAHEVDFFFVFVAFACADDFH